MADGKKPGIISPKLAWVATAASGYAVLLPFIYLNGAAFHDGYLDYFRLNESMLPIDVPTTLIMALSAWVKLISIAGSHAGHWISTHWIISISFVLLALASAALLLKPPSKKVRVRAGRRTLELVPKGVLDVTSDSLAGSQAGPDMNHVIEHACDAESPSWLQRKWHWLTGIRLKPDVKAFLSGFFSRFGKVTLFTYLGFAFSYSILMLCAILLTFQLAPFSLVGQHEAHQDDQNGFKNFPEVTLQAPDGIKSKYRIIECYGSFCAVYQKASNEKKGRAYTVPSSAIVWSTTLEPVAQPSVPKSAPKETNSTRTNSG